MQTPRTRPLAAHGVLLLVQFLFATFPVAGKFALPGFEHLAIAFWRVVFGGGVLLLLAARRNPGRWWIGSDAGPVFLLSMFGVSINQVMFIIGLSRSSAVTAGLMMGVIPVATYGLSLLVRQDRFSVRQVAGLAAGLAGAALLALQKGGADGGSDTLGGNLLLLGNSVSYSIYLVLARPVLMRRPALVVTAWTFLFAIPVVGVAAAFVPLTLQGADLRPLLALGWILLIPTAVSYSLISWALQRLKASIIAMYVFLQPVLGTLLAILLLEEEATIEQLRAGGLVVGGLLLVTLKRVGNQAVARSETT